MLHASRFVPWQTTLSKQQLGRFMATGTLCLKPRAVVRIFSKHSSGLSNRDSAAIEGRRLSGCSLNVLNTIARSDEQTNLNHKPLYDELQRYGVDFADYGFTVDQNSNNSRSNNTVSISASRPVDSRMAGKDVALRKRKAADLAVQRRTLKEESGVIEDWCAYLLISADSYKTYVGVTYDIRRRLRQHNGEIAGGAKAARAGRPWSLVCTVRGFETRSEACQFEWRWKAAAAKIKTVTRSEVDVYESPLIIRRRAALDETLNSKDEWKDLQVEWHSPETSPS